MFAIIFALGCLAFSIGFCLAGALASGDNDDERRAAYVRGYNAGLEAGRAEAHADYQRRSQA